MDLTDLQPVTLDYRGKSMLDVVAVRHDEELQLRVKTLCWMEGAQGCDLKAAQFGTLG